MKRKIHDAEPIAAARGGDDLGPAEQRRRNKAASNRASYARSKPRVKAILLRLEADELAAYDAARANTGLSRSAFAKQWAIPALAAVSQSFAEVESARRARGLSLATFLQRAIATAIERNSDDAPPQVASEFDALFAQEDGPC